MDDSKRFVTVVLGLGVLVLVLAIFIGERMGSHVLGSAVEERDNAVQAAVITPAPQQSTKPYGPDWKRSQTLAAAGDPGFPDPRIPPKPLPTPPPATPTPSPKPRPTYNPNIPIWRQPYYINSPSPSPSGMAVEATASPVDGPSIPPP